MGKITFNDFILEIIDEKIAKKAIFAILAVIIFLTRSLNKVSLDDSKVASKRRTIFILAKIGSKMANYFLSIY